MAEVRSAMRLWILRNRNPQFGQTSGLVVRADGERDARRMASGHAYGEGPSAWSDPERTTCEEVSADGVPMAILVAYSD